ncbi:MAG: hypothetical protein ABI646_03215 [Acidobacteriota bacterium]
MKKAAFILGFLLSLVLVGAAQTRIVTNSTLQKFQEKRLAAERHYRENYARLGLPSPEELDRQRDLDMAARLQLAEQLRQARLERERVELERRNLDIEASALSNDAVEVGQAAYGGGFYGGFYSGGRYRRHGGYSTNRRFRSIDGYRATPVGVYPVSTPRPQLLFYRGRRSGGAIIRTGRH